MGLDDKPIQGNLDVLALKLLNGICGIVESSQGLRGFQQSMSPFLEMGIRESGLGNLKLPKEVKMIGEMWARGFNNTEGG